MDILVKHVLVKNGENKQEVYGHVGIQDGKVLGIWGGDERHLPVAKLNLEAYGKHFDLGAFQKQAGDPAAYLV